MLPPIETDLHWSVSVYVQSTSFHVFKLLFLWNAGFAQFATAGNSVTAPTVAQLAQDSAFESFFDNVMSTAMDTLYCLFNLRLVRVPRHRVQFAVSFGHLTFLLIAIKMLW
jgi:hypothetical protein